MIQFNINNLTDALKSGVNFFDNVREPKRSSLDFRPEKTLGKLREDLNLF